MNEVNTDFAMSPAVREVFATLNELEKLSNVEQVKQVGALRDVVNASLTQEYAKNHENLSTSRKILEQLTRNVYTNMLISLKRLPADLMGNTVAVPAEVENHLKIRNDKDLSESYNNINRSVVDFLNEIIGSVHANRVIGAHNADISGNESKGLGSSFSKSNSMGEGILELMQHNKAADFGKAMGEAYYKVTDYLITKAWKMEFAVEFQNITGETFNAKRAMKDERYLTSIKPSLKKAVARADKHVSDMFNTSLSFERKTKAKKRGLFDVVNNFMQSFSYGENSVLWSGVKSAIGRGSMGQKEGAVKALSAIARIYTYNMIMRAVYDMAFGAISGQGDDDDIYEILSDGLKKSTADVLMIAALGQYGGFIKGVTGGVLNTIQTAYEKKNNDTVMYDGKEVFFGIKNRSGDDVLRGMGPLGYIAIEVTKSGGAVMDAIIAGASDEDMVEPLNDFRVKLAAFRVVSLSLGLPFVKDVGLVSRALKENKKKKNTSPY